MLATLVKALVAGKHVFVEKPLCLEENQLQEIFSVLRKGMRKGGQVFSWSATIVDILR